MNTRELLEDGGFDYSGRTSAGLERIGQIAASAANKFRGAHGRAVDDVQADNAAATKAELGADAPADDAPIPASFADLASAQITLAGIILDRTPDEDDVPELDSLPAAQFVLAKKALAVIQKRFSKFGNELEKDLKAAPFINDYERDEISDRMNDTNPKREEASEAMLMQNENGERHAWMLALTKDDVDQGTAAIVRMIGTISKRHQAKNDVGDKKKSYATGLNLVNVAGFQRQIIDTRIALLSGVLDKLENKAVSDAGNKPSQTQVKETLSRLRKFSSV